MRDNIANNDNPLGKKGFVLEGRNMAHFLDDWPQPPKHNYSDENDPNFGEVKKWRLQTLLAVNPWGIPSLAFADAYKRMFGKPLDVQDLGFLHLSEMVNSMTDVFAVQEPDESTRILFPDYARDRILHDARIGFDFARPNLDLDLAPTHRLASRSSQSICNSISSDSLAAQATSMQSTMATTGRDSDQMNELIYRAWMNRDEDFPPDVVLAGEPYPELLIISSANLPGTRGLYQATLLSAASPDSFYVQLKTNEQTARCIQNLPGDIARYFQECKYPIDAYSVPREFMYPGFPCLVYIGKEGRNIWERCIVAAKSKSSGKVLVEAVDFGGWYAVDPIYLYLIPRRFLEVPQTTFQISLAGLKPANSESNWSPKVGPRMRCFSYHNYWLDLLLMDSPNKDRHQISPMGSAVESSPSYGNLAENCAKNGCDVGGKNEPSDQASKKAEMTRLRFRGKPRFDAIVVDRNDDHMDIFLDEMLVLETYAVHDESRKSELKPIKDSLREVLKTLPRPTNPFYINKKA